MKINKNYEMELNLKDLLFHVLYKWWFLLLLGVVVAGYFGFKEYWSYEKYHRAGELAPAEIAYEADVESHQRNLDQAEKAFAEYEALVRDNNGGREVSILMGIDPTCIWTAEKKYYLDMKAGQDDNKTEDLQDSSKILVILSGAFSREIDGEKLTEVFGTDLRRDVDQVAFIYIDTNLRTLSVFGIGATKEEAVRRKEFVDSCLLDVSNKLSEKEKFTMEVIGDSAGSKIMLTTEKADGTIEMKDLAEIQNTLRDNYQDYLKQKDVYIQKLNSIKTKPFVRPQPQILKRGMIGMAIGAGIAVAILVLCYLFNGRMKTGREMRKRYDISLLGDFSHSRGIWKGKGLDWLLEKLEFGRKTDFENELNSIAFLMDEAKDGKTILMTGTLEEKRLKKVYDGLASRLRERGIELVFEPDYLHNSEAVVASRDLDSVLLVEEKYVSRVRDLNRIAEMLEIEEANVIGAVLL